MALRQYVTIVGGRYGGEQQYDNPSRSAAFAVAAQAMLNHQVGYVLVQDMSTLQILCLNFRDASGHWTSGRSAVGFPSCVR